MSDMKAYLKVTRKPEGEWQCAFIARHETTGNRVVVGIGEAFSWRQAINLCLDEVKEFDYDTYSLLAERHFIHKMDNEAELWDEKLSRS